MTRSLENLDVHGDAIYTRFKYRHQLISGIWERFNYEQRKKMALLLKVYSLRDNDIEDSIDYSDVRDEGFWENINSMRNLKNYSLNRLCPHYFNDDNETGNASIYNAEISLARHIRTKFQAIEDWLFNYMYEDEYYFCESCEEFCDSDEYAGNQECYPCSEHSEHDDDDNFQYEHERYCSSYNTRVEENISPKHLHEENVNTDLETSRDTWYGFEWEVMARRSMEDNFPEILAENNDWFQCKRDGSLDEGSGGFEICSAPSTFKFLKDRLHKLFNSDYWLDENKNTYVKGWNTGCAGIHFHISRRALTPLQIGKLLVFVNAKKNKRFIEDISGRSMGRWCESYEKNLLDGTERDSDRYQAVNTSNKNTVELRIFRSNVSENGVMRVLEFTDALVHFLKQSSMNSVSYKDFMRYVSKPNVRANYPTFWAWLITNGYVVGNPNRSVSQQFESVSNQ
tara:strand:+ start:589 stop:1950 length:1362 start_codon:yes stop_codon:yes gene_type:complete